MANLSIGRWLRNWWLLLLLVAVVFLPILLRPRAPANAHSAERTLIIITPHNQAIRHEFGKAFSEWYFARHGERVRCDWRSPGGTSEIARYLSGEYFASFQNYWTRELKQPWSTGVEKAFANPKIVYGKDAKNDTLEQSARRAFMESKCSSRIDLLFGGGAFDFQQHAAAGRLVDSGILTALPELFGPGGIPQEMGGEELWDRSGKWVGACLGAFGICSNTDSLARLGIPQPPSHWSDLGSPRYFREIALANPTQSSSVNKAFEMLIQEQIRDVVEGRTSLPAGDAGNRVANGWAESMRLIRRISANARYFTDASTKIALDVGAGDAAAGMTIDFFGRYQSEVLRNSRGESRLVYVDAVGGTSFGSDPVGLLRGAPNEEVAKEFIKFALSDEGQKLWNWKTGTPGGPERYALRRLPIVPSMYEEHWRQYRSDPDVDPYTAAASFKYQPEWTGPLFRQIAFVVRVMCIDPHDELVDAWRALIRNNFPKQAAAVFDQTELVSYQRVTTSFKESMGSKITEVQLAKELADGFRQQYILARKLAEEGR